MLRILYITNATTFYILREPLGLAYVAGAAKKAGHINRFCGIDPVRTEQVVREFSPDVVAYSTTSGEHALFLELNRHLKKKAEFFAVFGGPHPTFRPEMVSEPGVDAVCRGEGEAPFAELLRRIEAGREVDSTPSFWVKRYGEVYRNDVLPLPDDLDEIPWPDRESIFEAFPETRTNPIKCFIANRGCPYKCSYCFNERFWALYKGKGKRVRVRSPQSIVDEVNHIRAVSTLKMALFNADIFAYSKKWLAEFAEIFPKQVGLPFYTNVRAELVDDEYARLLAKAGCKSVGMGIEHGLDRVRNEVFNRNQSVEEIVRAGKALHDAGVEMVSYNILGVPGTTLDDDLKTLELNLKARASYAATFTLAPFPGTGMYEWLLEHDYVQPISSDVNLDYYGRSMLPIDQKDERERLYYLFGAAVRSKTVRSILHLLLRAPLLPLYKLLFRMHRGWYYKKKAFPIRHGALWTLKSVWRYLSYKHR